MNEQFLFTLIKKLTEILIGRFSLAAGTAREALNDNLFPALCLQLPPVSGSVVDLPRVKGSFVVFISDLIESRDPVMFLIESSCRRVKNFFRN